MSEAEKIFNLPAPKAPSLKGGRPTKYKPEIVEKVLMEVAEGRPLTRVLKGLNIDRQTMLQWRWRYPEIEKALAQARELGEEMILDECLEIADNEDEDHNSRRVRVWTRLQLLEKWNPKRWGPKQQVTMNHDFTSILEEARARIVSDQ